MSSFIEKLKDCLQVDPTLKEELLRGSHDLDEEEGRLVRSLIDEGSSSYVDADAVLARNILNKLFQVPPADVAYDDASRTAVAGTGNLLPIPLDEDLFETLLSELNGREHHGRVISVAAKLDIANEMLLTGTWNGVSHYGIDRAVESALNPMPELIKLSIEHTADNDEVRIAHFDPRAVAPFRRFRWFGGAINENIFILSRHQQSSRRETRLTLLHERGLGMKGIGFLGVLAREFPETKILLCTREREVDVSKSAIALMMMPLRSGDEVRIVASGPDADRVIDRIESSSPSIPVFLKVESPTNPKSPSSTNTIEVVVNEEQGVHFRVIGGLLGIAREYEGTKLYLSMDGADRIDVSRSFTRLCSMGIPSGKKLILTAEGPHADRVIGDIIEFKLDAKKPVFSLCGSSGRKGRSGDDDPDDGAPPAPGGHRPAGSDSGSVPPRSFSGIARDIRSNAISHQHDLSLAEEAWVAQHSHHTAGQLILGASAFAAGAVSTI